MKFKINKENPPENTGFNVINVRRRSALDIRRKGDERAGKFDLTWMKQEPRNKSDCGPMSIFNILKLIKFKNTINSVKQIRDAAAQNRLDQGESTATRVGGDIREKGWFNVSDVSSYLTINLGIPSEILSSRPELEKAKLALLRSSNNFYIIATGNHFKVLRFSPLRETFELLDSQRSGPLNIPAKIAMSLLDQSIGTSGVLALAEGL